MYTYIHPYLMNQEKFNRFLLFGRKVIKRHPTFHHFQNTEVQLNDVENFLTDSNLSAAVCCYILLLFYIIIYTIVTSCSLYCLFIRNSGYLYFFLFGEDIFFLEIWIFWKVGLF